MEKYGEIEIIGNNRGEPFLSFILGTHGDEQAPIKALNILKKELEGQKLTQNIKVIYANTEAIKHNKRFIEQDLNRSFGGFSSGSYEERLAASLKQELKKTQYNFDFHTTNFEINGPYGVISTYKDKIKEILSNLGIVNNVFTEMECLIKYAPNGIAFEVGYEKNPDTITSTVTIMRNILEHFGIIDKTTNSVYQDINIYLIYKLIDKLKFSIINSELIDFKPVKVGDKLGLGNDGQEIIAEEKFIPIRVEDKKFIRMAKRIHIEE